MTKICAECRRSVRRLRRDRCDACYMRLYRNGEVPDGAPCEGCGERRRIVLTVAHLGPEDHVLCGNCSLIAERARPRPATITELSRLASRERRQVPDRRRETRAIQPERRRGPRRAAEKSFQPPFLDPSID